MKTKNFIVAAAAALLIAAPAIVKADSTTATASATIAAPITVAKAADLEFGTIAPTGSAGTVTVSTTGTRTGDANVELLGGTTPSAASFNISGEPNTSYTVSVDTSATLTIQGGGTDTMAATLSNDANPSPSLDNNGDDTVNVGASLDVGANQAAGAYQGSFNVTVSYN